MTGHNSQYPLGQLLRMTETSTQAALQRKKTILYVSGCSESPEEFLSLWKGLMMNLTAEVCVHEGSVSTSQAVQKEVSKLFSVQDDGKVIVYIFFETLQTQEPEHAAGLRERQAESVFAGLGKGDDWQLVTSGDQRMASALSAGLQLHNTGSLPW